MALEMVLTRDMTEGKYPYPAAYAKVQRVQIDTSAKQQAIIFVTIYADADARKVAGAFDVDKRTVTCSLAQLTAVAVPTSWTDAAIKAAAYEYLKDQGWAGKDV